MLEFQQYVERNDNHIVNKNSGGKLGVMLEFLDNKLFKCSCGQVQEIPDNWRSTQTHYDHAGLPDKEGIRWWAFFECLRCGYQWSLDKTCKWLSKGCKA